MRQAKVEQLIFTFFVGAVFIGAAILSFAFPESARRFPLTVTILSALFVVIQILKLYLNTKQEDTKEDASNQKTVLSQGKKIAPYIIWILGFYLLIYIVGFVIASGIFVFAFLLTQAKLRWYFALISAAIVVAGILFLGDLLSLKWPFGLISDWFGIEL